MLLDRVALESGETVIKEMRRHKFVLVMELIGLSVAALAPLFGLLLLRYEVVTFELLEYLPLLSQFYLAWLLVLWIAAFSIWTNWYLDVLLITNTRLILVDQKGLWSRNTASFRLDRLQEVNVDISGVFATLLDFGTLHAETAGAADVKFNMTGLPDPRGLKALVMAQVESARNIAYNRVEQQS